MARKTKLMLRVEKQEGQPLEKFLPERLTRDGLSATAKDFGVGTATLGYWMLKLGIRVHRVAVSPGEIIEVKPR